MKEDILKRVIINGELLVTKVTKESFWSNTEEYYSIQHRRLNYVDSVELVEVGKFKRDSFGRLCFVPNKLYLPEFVLLKVYNYLKALKEELE